VWPTVQSPDISYCKLEISAFLLGTTPELSAPRHALYIGWNWLHVRNVLFCGHMWPNLRVCMKLCLFVPKKDSRGRCGGLLMLAVGTLGLPWKFLRRPHEPLLPTKPSTQALGSYDAPAPRSIQRSAAARSSCIAQPVLCCAAALQACNPTHLLVLPPALLVLPILLQLLRSFLLPVSALPLPFHVGSHHPTCHSNHPPA
jgi:hypothetical protein